MYKQFGRRAACKVGDSFDGGMQKKSGYIEMSVLKPASFWFGHIVFFSCSLPMPPKVKRKFYAGQKFFKGLLSLEFVIELHGLSLLHIFFFLSI